MFAPYACERSTGYRPRSAILTTGAAVVAAVPEDASLDAFASPDEEADDAETTDAETTDAETDESELADAEPTDSDAPAGDSAVAESPAGSAPTVEDADPAVSTYEWSLAGDECADCGASAERRWRADGERDGALVCADCKEW